MEVTRHSVQFSARFHFPCKMNANATSGVLETCKCRISVRLVYDYLRMASFAYYRVEQPICDSPFMFFL